MAEAVSAAATAVTAVSVCATGIFLVLKMWPFIPYAGAAALGGVWGLLTKGIDPILALGGGFGLGAFIFPALQSIAYDSKTGPPDPNNIALGMKGTSALLLGGLGAGIAHAMSKNLMLSALAGAGMGWLGAKYAWNPLVNFYIGVGLLKPVCSPNAKTEDCITICWPGKQKKIAQAFLKSTACQTNDPPTQAYCKAYADWLSICPTSARGTPPVAPPPVDKGHGPPVQSGDECDMYAPYQVWVDTPQYASCPQYQDARVSPTTQDVFNSWFPGTVGKVTIDPAGVAVYKPTSAADPQSIMLDAGNYQGNLRGKVRSFTANQYYCVVNWRDGWAVPYLRIDGPIAPGKPTLKHELPYTEFTANNIYLDKGPWAGRKVCVPSVRGAGGVISPAVGYDVQPVASDRGKFCQPYDTKKYTALVRPGESQAEDYVFKCQTGQGQTWGDMAPATAQKFPPV